jgi:DNA-binding response OmpR family regulator
MTVDASKPLVLVVEDNANIRRLARIGIERGGFTVDDVGDGKTAIARLDDAARKYVALVVDLGLPDIDGTQVVAHARRVRPGVAIIVCSGTQTAEYVAPIVLLPKPYQPLELGGVVRDAVKAAGGA